MIKLFIFTVFLLPYLGITFNVMQSNFNNKLINEIKDNSFELVYKNYRGSGILINYNKEKYVLTNIHVCLSHERAVTHFKGVGFTAGNVDFFLHNDKFTKHIYYNFKNVILDSNVDMCFIPVKTELTGYRINRPKNEKLYKKFLLKKYPEYTMVTNNFSKHTILRSGKSLNFVKGNIIRLDQKSFIESDAENVTIPIVLGDSGSPIFNKDLELVSLAFASRFDNITFNSITSIIENPKRSYVEATVIHGIIIPKFLFKNGLNNIK